MVTASTTKSEKVQVQGTIGAAETEYTGEKALFFWKVSLLFEDITSINQEYISSTLDKQIWTTLYREILHAIAKNNEVLLRNICCSPQAFSKVAQDTVERLLDRQQEVQHSWERSGSAACMYTVVGGPKIG